MRAAHTLIELILVLALAAILSAGTFKALEALYVRTAKAKALTELSLQSQLVVDQVGALLYERVPNSAIGYTPGGACEPLEELSATRPVIEWLGFASESLLQRDYSGFVDLNRSDKGSFTLSSPELNATALAATGATKFGAATDYNLVFSGSFDAGSEDAHACSGAFGWHGNSSDFSYDVAFAPDAITVTDSVKPAYIYEKYYLADTAYALTRGANLDIANVKNICGIDTDALKDFNTTLFLFYDYRPYKGETYCAESLGSGKASVLAEEVDGLRVEYVSGALRVSVDMQRSIRGSTPVHITKQKAVF